MYTVKTISLLALAGSAIAAPQWPSWGQGKWRGDNDGSAVQTDVAVVTAYTTVTWGGNWGHSQPTATAAPETPAPEAPKPSAPAPSAPAPSAPAPSAPAPSSSAPATGSGSTDGYMGVVAEWRSKMGMSALTEDSTLAANALKTAADGNGEMVHQLNPGSMAQVLAPGDAGDFEKVFVGGWLCEIPSLPGLDGVCETMSQGWAYAGQTGHAEILSSTSYSKIGCGNAGGIWSCDLA